MAYLERDPDVRLEIDDKLYEQRLETVSAGRQRAGRYAPAAVSRR